MLTTEKAELIDRILAHQRELSIPAETKTLRLLRMIVTSTLILTVFALYRPLSLHAPPIVNLFAELALAAGVAYLVSQAWPYMRWIPGPLQFVSGVVMFGVLVSLYATVATLTAPAKPGVEKLSWAETFSRLKRGDLTRIKTMGLPVSDEEAGAWAFAVNPGEETYRKLTLEEAKTFCAEAGLRVPSSREEILALAPRPRVPRSLSLWTLEGRAYQYRGGENETLGVSVSGGPEATFYVLCLK